MGKDDSFDFEGIKDKQYYIDRLKTHDKSSFFGIDEVRFNQWLMFELLFELKEEVRNLKDKRGEE